MTRRAMGVAMTSAMIVLATACVHEAPRESMGRSVSLYFGREWPSGTITEEQFAAFEAEVIVPTLPAGYTRVAAEGHYRGPDGRQVVEPSFIISVVFETLEAAEAASASLDAIRARYCQQFSQDAVLRVDADARIRFSP